MAFENNVADFTIAATADLRTHQHKLISIATGTLAGAGVPGFVLQNEPNTAQAASLRAIGISKVVSGAAFSLGDKLMSNATGKAITATGTNNVVGIAMEAASGADVVVTMLCVQQGIA